MINYNYYIYYNILLYINYNNNYYYFVAAMISLSPLHTSCILYSDLNWVPIL